LPHFVVNITKQLGEEKWDNVYYLAADNLSDAVTKTDAIVDIERAVNKTTVHFIHTLTSEREQPFRNYSSRAIDALGLVTATSGELPLPLWNTVRCEFQPTNSGKPDVKQLRLPIYTDEIVDIQHITTVLRSAVNGNYAAPLVALGGIEDDAGNAWVSYFVRAEVFDRQLTKRRRKKVTA